MYVDDAFLGINLPNKFSRALDMCEHDVVVTGVDLPESEIESINKELSLRTAKINSILNQFKQKF